MSEERMNEELAAIEAALGSLTPVASGIDRDRLMFLAGRASAEQLPSRRRFAAAALWLIATAAMTAVAAVVLLMLPAGRGAHGPSRGDQPVAALSGNPIESNATIPGSSVQDLTRAAMRRWLAESGRGQRFTDVGLPDDRLAASDPTDRQGEDSPLRRSLIREANIDRGISEHAKFRPPTSRENAL